MKQLAITKVGSMRFWGDWFGRPMDNCHRVISATMDNESGVLTMAFDGGETCIVYGPQGIGSSNHEFYVSDATCVIWSHYYYGRTPTPDNLSKTKYIKENEHVVIKTLTGCLGSGTWNIDSTGFHAVEIL